MDSIKYKKTYYNYNDGETTDESLWEIIQYLKDADIDDEDILGMDLEICELKSVYSGDDYMKIQDILYSEADLYCDEYFQRARAEILNKVESVKYLNPIEKYIITKEDLEDYYA